MLEVKITVDGDPGVSEIFHLEQNTKFPLPMTHSTKFAIGKFLHNFHHEEFQSLSVKKGSVTYQISRI